MSSKLVQPTKRGANPKRLNAQQQDFVGHLLADRMMNPTAAATKAGYGSPSVSACKLMKHPVVAAIIGKEMRERQERLQVRSDKVLTELARLSFSNVRDLYDKNGNLLPPHKLPTHIAAAIASYDVEFDKDTGRRTKVRVRFYNKLDALQLIMKHLGMLDERFKVNIETGFDSIIAKLIQMAEQPNTSNIIDASSIQQVVEADDVRLSGQDPTPGQP